MADATTVTQDEMDAESDRLFSKLNEYMSQFRTPNDWQDLFNSWDSKFHQGIANQSQYVFNGVQGPGSDLNYYFEGQLFYLFGYPKTVLYSFMQIWKWKQYRVLPTKAAYDFADMGHAYRTMERFSRYLKVLKEWKAAHPKAIAF